MSASFMLGTRQQSSCMLRGAKQQRRKRARAEDSDAEEDVADTAPEQEGSGLQPLVSSILHYIYGIEGMLKCLQ